MNSFGQEFYPHESIRALKAADRARLTDRRALVLKIAEDLPHDSERTRLRVASKIVQRFLDGNNSTIVPAPQLQPFARLVARNKRSTTQIELLFLRLARIDGVVGRIARELFYPVCVVGRPPYIYGKAEFAALNGGQLFAPVPMLTRSFIHDHARNNWEFTNTSTLDRALRILQTAGLIASERMPSLRGHPDAFTMLDHDVSLVTFIWALYEEFLPHAGEPNFTLLPDDIAVAEFAKMLLLSPEQVAAHCESARWHQLLALHQDGLRFVYADLDGLTDGLLMKAV